MMASVLRFSALAAVVSAVSGYALGEMPSQTIGIGMAITDIIPTNAPSLELVKRSLKKKAVTNTCSEWTISEGLGYTPICDASMTCLFTSATDGFLYEGCGQTSVAYNWITQCYDYNVKTGLPPLSQTYCNAVYPYCGYFQFIYDDTNTFWNFGCSDSSYSTTAYLVSTASTADLAAGGTTKITEPPTVTVTKGPDTTFTDESTPTDESSSDSTSDEATPTPEPIPGGSTNGNGNPTIKSHAQKKKKPIGAIAGGVVGGVVVLAIAAFLLWWFLRKRNRNDGAAAGAAVTSTQPPVQEDTAYNNQNRISEMGGDPKPPTVFPPTAGYAQQGYQQGQYNGPEKPVVNPTTQEFYQPAPSTYSSELSSQSPPPVYAQPPHQQQQPPLSPPLSSYPPSNYTELDNTGRQSVPPSAVSPVGTYSNIAHSPTPTPSELGGGLAPAPAPVNRTSELGDTATNRASYQTYNPAVPEMSATAPSVQRPVRQSGVDMSGAPMSESYHPQEMP